MFFDSKVRSRLYLELLSDRLRAASFRLQLSGLILILRLLSQYYGLVSEVRIELGRHRMRPRSSGLKPVSISQQATTVRVAR